LIVEGERQLSLITCPVLETGKKIPDFLYPETLGREKLLGPIFFMLNSQAKIFIPSMSVILVH